MQRRALLVTTVFALSLGLSGPSFAQDAGTAEEAPATSPAASAPEATKDTAKEATKEAPKEAKKEAPKAATKDAAKDKPKDKAAATPAKGTKNPVVVIKTNHGTIKAELYEDKAPVSVKNFLEYVEAKHYDGTIFHRVIDNFMIQGGGYDANMKERPTRAPIKNEANNGLKNTVGTLAMARTMVPDSATAQFYINVRDNAFLDYRDPSPQGIGYAVFGKVIEGMDVVNKIKGVPTGTQGGMQDVPQKPVTIESIRRQK